jgi:hypothetical protein
MNRIGGVMVSLLPSSAVDSVGLSPDRIKPKIIKLVFVDFNQFSSKLTTTVLLIVFFQEEEYSTVYRL